MNRHGLDVLQFPEALSVVAKHASSPLGAEAVRALQPSDMLALVRDELHRVDQMSAFLLRAQDWTVPPLPDARTALRRLAMEGSVLDAPELRDVAIVIRSADITRRAILQHESDYPLLALIAQRLVKLADEERRIRAAIDDAGAVRDNASPDRARPPAPRARRSPPPHGRHRRTVRPSMCSRSSRRSITLVWPPR